MFLFYHTNICVHKHTHKVYTDTHRHTLSSALAFIPRRDLRLFWLAFRAEPARFRSGEEECVHTKHALRHTCTHTFSHHLHISKNTHPQLAKTEPSFLFPRDTLVQTETYLNETQALTLTSTSTHQTGMCCCPAVALELLITQHLHTDKTAAIR